MHDGGRELEGRGAYAHGGEVLNEEWIGIIIYKAMYVRAPMDAL